MKPSGGCRDSWTLSSRVWTAKGKLARFLGRPALLILLVAAAFAGVMASLLAAPGLKGVLGASLALTMLAIAYVDAVYFLIPDQLSAIGFTLGIVDAVRRGEDATQAVGLAIFRAGIIALSFLVLRAAYYRFRGREGIGLGDVKLAAIAGVWLDVSNIPLTIELAALSALAVYGGRHCISRDPLSATSRVPFGFFLAPSIWLTWLFQAIWFDLSL